MKIVIFCKNYNNFEQKDKSLVLNLNQFENVINLKENN